MVKVALTGWDAGFVANRLTALLREFGYGLAEAHGKSSALAAGQIVELSFDRPEEARQFVERARSLNVHAATEREAGAA